MHKKDDAVSTVTGVILIVFLVVALSAVMYVIIYGLISPVEKTAYVVTKAEMVNSSSGIDVISLTHLNGDTMQYENLTINPPYEVRFVIETSEGEFPVRPEASLLSDTTWSPGNRLYFFKNATGYHMTDDIALITGAIPFPHGSPGVRVIDNTHHQLVSDQLAETSAGGSPSVPTPSVSTSLPVTTVPTTAPATIVPTTAPATTVPTTAPTTIVPTTAPVTTIPTVSPSQTCVNCGTGESFIVSFTTEIRGPRQIRFKDASSPQPNLRAWNFGDGGSASGELIDHTFPTAGSYLITLTVKKNNSPCTCTLIQWITVS